MDSKKVNSASVESMDCHAVQAVLPMTENNAASKNEDSRKNAQNAKAQSTSKKPTPSPSDSKILELESGFFKPRKEIRLECLSTQRGDEIHDSSPKAESPQALRIAFLSVLYSGKSPKTPGTAGSALSVLLGLPILLYSAQTLFLLACLIGAIAVREIDKWEAYSKKHDEKWIVIDELVGVWLAMSILCYGNPSLWLTIDKSADIWLTMSTLWHEGHFAHIMLAFVLFRVFDIWKPSIIGRVDKKLKGGLGVVLDDVAAGIVAGIAGIVVLFAYDVAAGIISARAY